MTLRERALRAVTAELGRVADQLAEQTPHRGLRQSIVPPTPAQLPKVLRQVGRDLRVGQPDLHQDRA